MKLYSKGRFEAKGDNLYGKDVLRVGRWVHPITGQDINMTQARLENLVRQTRRFAEAGNRIPYPKGHNTDPEKNRGFWNGQLVLDKGQMFGAVEVLDAKHREGLDNGTIDGVSVNIEFDHVDPKGNHYDEVITHICSTNYPVVTEQGGFMKLSAEAEVELGRDVLFMDWNEADHPRDEKGQFADMGGGTGLGDEHQPKKHQIKDQAMRDVFDKHAVKWTGDNAINYSGDKKDGHWSSYKTAEEGWGVQHNNLTGEVKIQDAHYHVPGRTSAIHKTAAEVDATLSELAHQRDKIMETAKYKVSVGHPMSLREEEYLSKYVSMKPDHRRLQKERYMNEVVKRSKASRGATASSKIDPGHEKRLANAGYEKHSTNELHNVYVHKLSEHRVHLYHEGKGAESRGIGDSDYEPHFSHEDAVKEAERKSKARDFRRKKSGLEQFVEAVRPGTAEFFAALEQRSGLARFIESLKK